MLQDYLRHCKVLRQASNRMGLHFNALSSFVLPPMVMSSDFLYDRLVCLHAVARLSFTLRTPQWPPSGFKHVLAACPSTFRPLSSFSLPSLCWLTIIEPTNAHSICKTQLTIRLYCRATPSPPICFTPEILPCLSWVEGTSGSKQLLS